MGGLPTHWRTLTAMRKPIRPGATPSVPSTSSARGLLDVTATPGERITSGEPIVPDLAECTSHGIEYFPVIFPGFSWTNLNDGPFNQIPRNGGNFYWRQAYNAVVRLHDDLRRDV